MDISVGEYIVMEGLAEGFAAELYGPECIGQWVSAVLAPTYGGYAVGYRLVQAYMRKTSRSAAEATLVPSAEILRVADYF